MSEPSILIRPENQADVEAITEVTRLAFATSPLGHRGETELVERLRAACPDMVSLCADLDGRVVGHILFTEVILESPSGERRGMGLAPMSVLPEHQRHGIGSRLVRRGLELVRDAGHPFVAVLGHPEFYPRFGFELAEPLHIRSEFEGAERVFFVQFFAGDATRGLIRYRPEFS